MSSEDELQGVGANGLADGDEDDDISPQARRKYPAADTANGHNEASHSDVNDDADLFGSDADDLDGEGPRQLDDKDLDSGRELDNGSRAVNDDEDEVMPDMVEEERTLTSLTVDVGRQQVPEPGDGELYLLKVPQFLAIEPTPFELNGWTAPTADHHMTEPSETFSAHSTAMSTVRWRKSPSNANKTQSNARILRWSDGSLTLQLASEPTKQYSLPGKPLAPQQINPAKPTPVSLKRGREGDKFNSIYDPGRDSFTYLLTPSSSNELLRVTNKITAGLSVQPTADAAKDAIAKLQAAMKLVEHEKGGAVQTHVTEDPELAKKRAELAEKEIARMERKRLNAATRSEGRGDRSMGRRVAGGLTVGGLEDDDELGQGYQGGRTAATIRKPKQRRPNRRGEIYSDDEEEGDIRGRTKEDEYDEEDDFVAGSDEEEEQDYGDDDDDDLDEGISLDQVKKQQKHSNGQRPSPDAGGRADAGSDDFNAGAAAGEGSPVSRSKRRRVIDDDDDDED